MTTEIDAGLRIIGAFLAIIATGCAVGGLGWAVVAIDRRRQTKGGKS